MPVETIMALLGWKTRDMLDHYDAEDNQDLEDGVAKLAALHAAYPAHSHAIGV